MATNNRQEIIANQFYAPKLNLDKENSAFSKEKPELKSMLNGTIESWNGDGFWITNELSNEICFKYPNGYKLNGKIKLNNDEYLLLFITPNSNEIGLLDSTQCKYTVWANSKCLGFNEDYWIDGVYKYNQVCESRSVYIVDGLNPDRVLEIDKPSPKVQIGNKPDACKTPVYSNELDCNQLLANSLIKFPCIKLSKGTGILPDGKYRIGFVYTDEEQAISDVIISSEIVLYDNNQNGLDVQLTGIDTRNKDYRLILLTSNRNGTNNYNLGVFNTAQTSYFVTDTGNTPPIGTEELFTISSPFTISSHIAVVNNQLIKASVQKPPELHYQPFANQILSNWVVKRVPANQAYKHPQYNRDELAVFFIEWVDASGNRTSAFPIPNNTPSKNSSIVNNKDVFELRVKCEDNKEVRNWEIYNTANIREDLREDFRCDDTCEQIILRGEFGYFESEDKYPDDTFIYKGREQAVFGNLACTPIKIHKFPNNCLTNHYYKCEGCNGAEFIDVLGVEFTNIQHPVDLDGNPRKDIVGYRILRANKAGNETILSKGIISNMLIDEVNPDVLFPNFPYNDLRENPFISKKKTTNPIFSKERNFQPYTKYSQTKFTYISPETSYTVPQQGTEFMLYNEQIGYVEATVEETYKHPKAKLMTDFSHVLAGVVGVATGAINYNGNQCKTTSVVKGETVTTGKIGMSLPLMQVANGTSTVPISGGGTAEYGTTGTVVGGARIPDVINTPVQPKVVSVEILPNNKVLVYFDSLLGTGGGSVTITILNLAFLPYVATGAFVGNGSNPVEIQGIGVAPPVGSYLPGQFTPIVAGTILPKSGVTETKTETIVSSNICESPASKIKSTGILGPVKFITDVMASFVYAFEGMRTALDTIKAFTKFQQYAHQVNTISRPGYSLCGNVKQENSRRQIKNFGFLQRNKEIIAGSKVNNLNRNAVTYLEFNDSIEDPQTIDTSRFLPSKEGCDRTKFEDCGVHISSNYYGAVKRRLRSPYGRLYNVGLVPISCWNYPEQTNITTRTKYSTEDLYDGDTYITKMSYKVHMPLFLNIPLGEENGFELDYSLYSNIGYTRFWINSRETEVYELIGLNLLDGGSNLSNLDCASTFQLSDLIPGSSEFKTIFVKEGKFYTSVNGVYDFYVESSYINDYRVKSTVQEELHYPHQDYNLINRSDRHAYDNTFIYDQFLRLNPNYSNSVISTEYNFALCKKEDFRLIYSNQFNNQETGDSWRVFRPLSYTQLSKDFGPLTSIASIDNSMLLLFFEDATFRTQPDETFISKQGTNVLVGSGDIFSRKLVRLSVDDTGYTGCVDKYSIKNTRHGITWFDRKRKKAYLYTDKLTELNQEGINQWLQTHLISKKPTNHAESIKTIYDNHYDKIYFTYPNNECSWTLSYKPGLGFVSFHSFIPTEYFSLSNDFLSADNTGIWKHNVFNQSYQTYYGVQYPYSFSYVANQNTPTVFQSFEIKTEVTSEVNYRSQIFRNNVFFNRFNIYTENSNSGLLEVAVKNPNDRMSALYQGNEVFEYNGKCTASHVETNYWRLNRFRNFAIDQPHVSLNCDGHTVTYQNINSVLNPREAGNIRGNWAVITLENSAVYDLRFKTFISIATTDKIVR